MRRLVMLRAWEIKRANVDKKFGECLRLAWAEHKKNVKYDMIIPTKKQIGAIYAAFKKGFLTVSREKISEMYHIFDMHQSAVFNHEQDYVINDLALIGRCVNALFAQDYEYVSTVLSTL